MLTVNLDKSDLPLQTAFPIMMTNLLNWFGGTKGELREALAAGAVAEVELPAGEGPAIARWCSARPTAASSRSLVPAGATKATVGPLDHAASGASSRRRSAPGSQGEPRQGRPAPRASRSPSWPATWPIAARATCGPPRACPSGRPSLAAGLAVRPIWYYLLASALMLTCWEWFLYQRRWID